MKKYILFSIILFSALWFLNVPQTKAAPLTVHPSNPRYFTDGSGKAIRLAGHQSFVDFQDYTDPSQYIYNWQKTLDWSWYMNFVIERKLNYIRSWIRFKGRTPSVYARTGPGNASDGLPKVDLYQFNQEFFDRLRSRTADAGSRGIYVSIMLFDVWSFGSEFNLNYFDGPNNIQGIDADSNGNGRGIEFFSTANQTILDIQRAYIRKVIDTVNDLDNVIYEVGNEVVAVDWQYDTINYIKSYEASKTKQHLVLMGAGGLLDDGNYGNLTKNDLVSSNADCFSISDFWSNYNIPSADYSGKPAIWDNDHMWITSSPYAWNTHKIPWIAFTRGYHYNLYDEPFENPSIESAEWETIRYNVGVTVTYANKFSDLSKMNPRDDLCSTAYCLANPGQEYLAYQPSSGSFTVNLQAGTYSYEWFNPSTGSIVSTGSITAGGGSYGFNPPFSGDAVLYLKNTGSGVNHLPVGYLDAADSTKATGWAYDQDAGASPVTVQIYVDGVLNGTTVANFSRPDLVTAGVAPDPYHGFSYNFSNLSAGTHTVRAYAINIPAGTNPELPGSPKTITVSASSDPVAYWKFDETSGTIASDSSGNGNTGTLVNGPIWTTGKIGNALSFDGVDDYVNISIPYSLTSGVASYSFWINPKAGSTDWRGFLSDGVNDHGFFIGPDGLIHVFNSSGTDAIISLTPVVLGTWTHVVVTWDNVTARMYLNGAQNKTSATSPVFNVSMFGHDSSSAGYEWYPGLIDDVRIWNRAVSAEEITDLYNAGSDTTPPAAPSNVRVQ